MSKRTLVTSALPYANGPIHLGHIAGAYLPADLFVRYRRLKNDDIVYICGSDEHGVPITIAAEKEGVTPQEIVDRFHERNKKVFREFGISFDYYGRTSSPLHYETSQEFFTTLHEKGIFVKKTENQLYDEEAGMFLPDRYVTGTCPVCGYEEAYGDQCEKCGTSLSPSELINPKSVLSGNPPVPRETEHWYLPLGEMQPEIEEWISTRKNWKPNVMGQVKSWLQEGLHDRAVSRDLTWGVPVPLEEAENKVLYVWFDAPIGYISFTREWAIETGQPDRWKEYWQDEDATLYHFIGKDNIVFHCIMFPLMLMKHGKYLLPENVPANEFLNLEGRKLSTSKGWAVWLEEYMERYEPDILRYVLGTTLPETRDSDFSWREFQSRNNSELADILGNFLFRTLSFTERFFDGRVPELVRPGDREREVLEEIDKAQARIEEAYEKFRFREAIAETMNLARIGNKYFTESEPWRTRKEDPDACATTLHVCLQISAALSVLFEPILPGKMILLRKQLGLPENPGWSDVGTAMLRPGQMVESGEILFRKIEDEEVEAELERLRSRVAASEEKTSGDAEAAAGTGTSESTATFGDGDEKTDGDAGKKWPELKETIEYPDFARLDLRVAQILAAEEIPGSDKLLKLSVDLGFETRTILSGIKENFKPDELIGKKVVVVANLKPRKMMGEMSNGMVLMAEEDDGSLYFLSADAENGSPVY